MNFADFRKHCEDELARLKKNTEWLESGKLDIYEIDSSGQKFSLIDSTIENNKRSIEEYKTILADMDAKGY